MVQQNRVGFFRTVGGNLPTLEEKRPGDEPPGLLVCMEPVIGVEPTTSSLQVRRSTN